jgi:hypothetical protein
MWPHLSVQIQNIWVDILCKSRLNDPNYTPAAFYTLHFQLLHRRYVLLLSEGTPLPMPGLEVGFTP